jgi:hypothetical protein
VEQSYKQKRKEKEKRKWRIRSVGNKLYRSTHHVFLSSGISTTAPVTILKRPRRMACTCNSSFSVFDFSWTTTRRIIWRWRRQQLVDDRPPWTTDVTVAVNISNGNMCLLPKDELYQFFREIKRRRRWHWSHCCTYVYRSNYIWIILFIGRQNSNPGCIGTKYNINIYFIIPVGLGILLAFRILLKFK